LDGTGPRYLDGYSLLSCRRKVPELIEEYVHVSEDGKWLIYEATARAKSGKVVYGGFQTSLQDFNLLSTCISRVVSLLKEKVENE
jgi:hypothetical protein